MLSRILDLDAKSVEGNNRVHIYIYIYIYIYILPQSTCCRRIDLNRTEDYGKSGTESSSNCNVRSDRLTFIKVFITAVRNRAFPRSLLAESF
jgi:hypothetical protein